MTTTHKHGNNDTCLSVNIDLQLLQTGASVKSQLYSKPEFRSQNSFYDNLMYEQLAFLLFLMLIPYSHLIQWYSLIFVPRSSKVFIFTLKKVN